MPNFVTDQELIEKQKTLVTEIKSILAKPDFSAEDQTTVDRMLEEQKQVKSRIEAFRAINEFSVDVQNAIDESKRNTPSNNNSEPVTPKGFKSFGEQLQAMYHVAKFGKSGADPRLQWYSYSKDEVKALNEAVGADGGFLVQPEFSSNMLALMAENSIVRNNGATVIPMSARSIQIPTLNQTGTTEGISNYFAGIRVYMQAEASNATSSQPQFSQVELVANKMLGYTVASEELLADSAISLEAFLTGRMGFAGAMSHEEDYLFLNGNGVGQPQGVLNSPATITVNRREQADVTYEDLVDMEAAFYSANNNRGVWVASQSLKAKLMTMTGPTGNPFYLWGNAVEGRPNQLLGRPIIFTLDQLPRTTNDSEGDLLLADFSYYLIGDRQSLVMESSREANFQSGQIAWRAVHRFDGQSWLKAPLTSRDGVTQVSPFVQLGAKTT